MSSARSRSRNADVLGYAFSADGSLDPGTKLLDVGLDHHTPLAARRSLLADPLHMSVAIHELTHFVSLENSLGHVMGFLAMRAKTLAGSIEQAAIKGEPLDESWIKLYAVWHLKYRVLLELWRPLLEGLAVYAQVHEPREAGNELIEPVQILLTWNAFITAVGANGSSMQAAWAAGQSQFLRAAYDAIRKGPTLSHGSSSLAVSFEFVKPSGLRPYFLGHAYIRALHAALVEKAPVYASGERFFNLTMRILRSSTRRLLSDTDAWAQPLLASRIYGWVDVVREAPAGRVQALGAQDDFIDALHYLATGEECRGYDGTGRGDVDTVQQIVPQFWKEFEATLSQYENPKLPANESPTARAGRLVAGWIAGTMALNLSSNGEVRVVGWIPNALVPSHAVALEVDDRVWWAAVSDDDLALLIDDVGALPQLSPTALREPITTNAAAHLWLMDSYVSYTPVDPSISGAAGTMMPNVAFRLWNPATPDSIVHLEIAGTRPGVIGPHLRTIADRKAATLQFAGLSQLRRDVRDALSSAEVVDVLRNHGHGDLADKLAESIDDEDLLISRMTADVERHILATLLQRAPVGDDLELLERGVGVVPNAEKFGSLIAATYSAFALADAQCAGRVRTLNAIATQSIGKPLFAIDATGIVRYRGLWGGA